MLLKNSSACWPHALGSAQGLSPKTIWHWCQSRHATNLRAGPAAQQFIPGHELAGHRTAGWEEGRICRKHWVDEAIRRQHHSTWSNLAKRGEKEQKLLIAKPVLAALCSYPGSLDHTPSCFTLSGHAGATASFVHCFAKWMDKECLRNDFR